MKKDIILGNEFFHEIIKENNYYVDKTLLIRDLILDESKVKIINRPRRFGKTLNLNMLKYFFDINKNSSDLFENLKISKYLDITKNYMNKYPVINISFTFSKFSKFKDFIQVYSFQICKILDEHSYLLKSDQLNEKDK